jgi:hypothetical protein
MPPRSIFISEEERYFSMRRVQIFVEHDIIARHFILNNTFSVLHKNFEVQYVFPKNDKRITIDVSSLNLDNVRLVPVDRRRIGTFRMLAKIRSIKIARKNRSYQFIDTTWKKLFDEVTYKYMWWRSLPIIHQIYSRRIIQEAGRYVELEQVIQDFNPDILLHPTVLEGLFISDLAMISQERKIPFVALMNSWDNPSTKAQVIRPPDWLAVWGEQSKKHAVEFLGMRPDRIRMLGAAQFDLYRLSPVKSREEVFASLGVDPAKKLICYAGSSKSVNEMQHLQVLDEAVEAGQLANCHILFRPHPWRAPADDEPDFYNIKWKHVSMDPTMKNFYNPPGAESKIHLSNIEDTHAILSAIDLLVVNMSTIMLEAIMHGKPVICMISDHDLKTNDFLTVSVNSIFFQELMEKLKIPRCVEYADIGDFCRRQLLMAAEPGFEAKQRALANYFIELGEKPYGERLSQFIDEILQGASLPAQARGIAGKSDS